MTAEKEYFPLGPSPLEALRASSALLEMHSSSMETPWLSLHTALLLWLD